MNDVVIYFYENSGKADVNLIDPNGEFVSGYSESFSNLTLAKIFANRILFNDKLKDNVNRELKIVSK